MRSMTCWYFVAPASRCEGLIFDSMLASYVLDPGRRSHGLDALALEMFNHRMIPYDEVTGKGRNQVTFDRVPVNAATQYSAEDADFTLRLYEHFDPLVDQRGCALPCSTASSCRW